MDNAAGLHMRFWGGIAAGARVPGLSWTSIELGRRRRGRETQYFLLKLTHRMEQQ